MEDYLEKVLEQIRCKKAREMIAKELKNHILDQTEENIHQGMSSQEAKQQAIREMGDPVEAGVALDFVHRPKSAWRGILVIGVISLLSVCLQGMLGRNEAGGSSVYGIKHLLNIVLGFFVMLLVYRLDYSFMARHVKKVAIGFLLINYLGIFHFGYRLNGAISAYVVGGISISYYYLFYLYLPIFAALLYYYRGTGKEGMFKLLGWMIAPCFLARQIHSISLFVMLFYSMSVLFTIAVCKHWFHIAIKKVIGIYWSVIIIGPIIWAFLAINLNWLASFQIERLRQFFQTSTNDYNYQIHIVSDFLQSSRLFGGSGKQVVGALPSYHTEYTFTSIASQYGIVLAGFVVVLLLLVAVGIFYIAYRQKNELGKIMGYSSGVVLIGMTLLHVLGNFGWIPQTKNFLPLFSYGQTDTVVCYILIGIVLSIYRYKEVLPTNLKSIT